MEEILNWLIKHDAIDDVEEINNCRNIGEGAFFINFGDNYDGPTEIAIYKDGRWELSYESRVDEISDEGCGLDNLIKTLTEYGAI